MSKQVTMNYSHWMIEALATDAHNYIFTFSTHPVCKNNTVSLLTANYYNISVTGFKHI